jgi:hypothetical protein
MGVLGTLHVNAAHALRQAERERLMEEFSIRFNGRHYELGPYRYGRLSDAIESALRSRAAPQPPWHARPSHSSPDGDLRNRARTSISNQEQP